MIIIFIFILGAAVGSFLNVLIDRLPNERKITGRSKCDFCRKTLQWYDLIPVASFFLLNGRCRYCHKKLSWQYPLVEILTGTMFIMIFTFKFLIFKFQILNYFLLFTYFGIISSLIVIFFADLKYQIIPDSMQITFLFFSFLLKSVEVFQKGCIGNQWLNCYMVKLLNCFGTGLIIMLPILLLWLITKGRGMGFGDVKLAFTIGFLLGIKAGFLALYIGFILGAVAGLILILLKKKKLKSKIAFGPFLVLGIAIMLFFQKELLQIVNNFYRF